MKLPRRRAMKIFPFHDSTKTKWERMRTYKKRKKKKKKKKKFLTIYFKGDKNRLKKIRPGKNDIFSENKKLFF